ncbi:hypothetical protein Hdeb2414_s0009g00302031 [Helianthus debilis subsp. tardiflorus]
MCFIIQKKYHLQRYRVFGLFLFLYEFTRDLGSLNAGIGLVGLGPKPKPTN